ncbi:LodA/GoxA family CTQ-dependent oxidase [uncultured Chryseobacterium sp.]|uniref:LodA/GoxA family CTQ-dependent oxidase n=1 Tax=uncultured Chryseobacterium sp. TaxID=259322 RepID=UPI0025DA18CD|nr:LodA/GoxA family CTQ-dependent oxidase [uncultured Chryseobacterium sp.]
MSQIKKVIIHPAIGVARVGNSPDEYFLIPEQINEPITDPGNFRDGKGRIKRQAARFRLFGADENGKIIRELTAEDGEITWTVHVANKKAAWYDFDLALDIPQARGVYKKEGYPAVKSTLRNASITDHHRKRLIIDGGKIEISGKSTNADGKDSRFAFDKGTFYSLDCNDKPVYLGEVRTDAEGRLLFLGGRGLSASYANLPATTFANNETWHDDTSDGPVDARIKLKTGEVLEASGSWVLTAPPDYSPGVQAFVTGYDLLAQTAADMGKSVLPETPEFWEHIYPMLERMPLNGWVNAGIFKQNGWGSPGNLSTPEMIARLSDASDRYFELRQAIFRQFRNPDYVTMQAELFPPVYGDGLQKFLSTDTDPRNFMAVLPFQYEYIRQWANGNFTLGNKPGSVEWKDLSPEEQAAQLDRSALDETIGGPFHPGCEFTWPIRQPILYSEPFRIKRRLDDPLTFGPVLDSEIALAPGGPLDGSAAGDITKWMAVPWQTDTSSCLSGYVGIMGQYVPTFWPVRVPNDVMTEADYEVMMNKSASLEEKNKAFSNRLKWLRGIVYEYGYPPKKVSPYTKGINEFITKWPDVGILIQKDGNGDANFPDKLWVENGRTIIEHPKMKSSMKGAFDQSPAEEDPGYLWMVSRAEKRRGE